MRDRIFLIDAPVNQPGMIKSLFKSIALRIAHNRLSPMEKLRKRANSQGLDVDEFIAKNHPTYSWFNDSRYK